MPLRLLPDVEATAVAYLRAHSAVAAIVGTRVSTELPSTPTFPLLTVRLVTGTEVIRTHLDEQTVQVDAWGADKAGASLLARTARAALLDVPGDASLSRGVVTGARTVRALAWMPDDTVSPPRPRYSFDIGWTVHPHII